MDDDIQFPVAVVPETIGGIKVDGRSPLQEAIARFIVATPDLYSACTHTLKTLAGEPTVKDLADVLSMLRKAIRKANAKGGAR
jgi:hypothetical protein